MREGHIEWEGHRTWYRIVGATDVGRPPLLITHGGPGLTHGYLEPLASLADGGRACIFYDQIGSGRSDRLPDAPRDPGRSTPSSASWSPLRPPRRGDPPVVAQLDEGIPHSEWVLFEESSHMPHVEETERFLEIVGSFLDRVDEAQASENSGR